jgi:hypothetical protein
VEARDQHLQTAARLDLARTGIKDSLQMQIAQIDKDADSMVAVINARRRQLTELAQMAARDRDELIGGQAAVLRTIAGYLDDDIATAKSVVGTPNPDPFRAIRAMPKLRNVIYEHTSNWARSDPCCPLSIQYNPPQDGQVAGLATWGSLSDVEFSLERSNLYAEIFGPLIRGKTCILAITIGPARTPDGTEIALAPGILEIIDLTVQCRGKRQHALPQGPWTPRIFGPEFGKVSKAYFRELKIDLTESGEHLIVASIGESIRKPVNTFFVFDRSPKRTAS